MGANCGGIMCIVAVCPTCRKQFSLKDEQGGSEVECPICKNLVIVPALSIEQDASKNLHFIPPPYLGFDPKQAFSS